MALLGDFDAPGGGLAPGMVGLALGMAGLRKSVPSPETEEMIAEKCPVSSSPWSRDNWVMCIARRAD